ncbi:14940_t:CDS:1, partial [Entrophospora sp. SA101]
MFRLITDLSPQGDQEKAIQQLVHGIQEGKKQQVLLGATGTGKTFTMAN